MMTDKKTSTGAGTEKQTRDRLLDQLVGPSRRASAAPGYYPGAGEYHPSRVLAGRAS